MRIALLGSAPSSIALAPYGDPTWKIWGCSPGAATSPCNTRQDAWFELHKYEPQASWFPDLYKEFLRTRDCPVFMIEHIPEFKNSMPYPYEIIKARHHRLTPFTSSFAWMLALALEQPGIEEIGFWGIDMAATEEYASQLAGAHWFIKICEERGIKITVPLESDVNRPYPEYGFEEMSDRYTKFRVRSFELAHRQRDCDKRIESATAELRFYHGAAGEREMLRKAGLNFPPDVRDEEIANNLKRAQGEYENAVLEKAFLSGAIDDLQYMKNRWPGVYEPRRNPVPTENAAAGRIQETERGRIEGDGQAEMGAEPRPADGSLLLQG